jgi:hypothetical protein
MVRIFQSIIRVYICRGGTSYSCILFVWLINHQPVRSTTNNQQILLFQNKSNQSRPPASRSEHFTYVRVICRAVGLLSIGVAYWHGMYTAHSYSQAFPNARTVRTYVRVQPFGFTFSLLPWRVLDRSGGCNLPGCLLLSIVDK